MRIAQAMESASDSIHVRASSQFYEHIFDFFKNFRGVRTRFVAFDFGIHGLFFSSDEIVEMFSPKKGLIHDTRCRSSETTYLAHDYETKIKTTYKER